MCTRSQIDIEDRFKKIQRYIDRMPSLSTTVAKVLQICNQPNTSANDLNRVISLDPVLAGQVLKLINSAYYSLPTKVTSLTRAIIVLGLNTVKNLALSTAVMGTLGKKKPKSLSMDIFWSHSICVGVTAKILAAHKRVPVGEHEEYFIAGLLHDVGKILLGDCFSEDYTRALGLSESRDCSQLEAERMTFGFDHCVTGRLVTEKWKLPNLIVETLAHHHSPRDASADCRDIVATVALGNIYANHSGIGSAEDVSHERAFIDDLLEMSGLEWSEIEAFDEGIRSEIEKAQIFLKE